MDNHFFKWSDDSSELIDLNLCGVFWLQNLLWSKINTLSVSINLFLKIHVILILVLLTLRQVSKECATVTLRQLNDFITGDFSKENHELSSSLKNCPLTNLVGESSFGDLDFDIS